ncbi:anti-sigma factor domain-containing protein [Micromonospora sp. NPDC005806]|uniref:anti-sigma factor n=1 Tax=Micromonospora sp. NPDC005806 TaxID=3364234 RepID=UPI0036C43C2F
MTDIHALAGPYVLDAVDDVERAAFARHLAECLSCASEVDELLATAARLADDVWSMPPPRLRAQVLAEVARTPQERPGRRPGRDGRAADRRWRTLTAAAVAAGVLAAGAGTVTYLVQEQRLRDERAVTAAARADTERIRQILGAPDLVVRQEPVAGGGQLTVASSVARDAGVVLLAGAPPIADDQAYQLWLMDGPTARPAGVLTAGVSGDTAVVTGVRGKRLVALTVEPAAGSAQPSTDPLVTVPLA